MSFVLKWVDNNALATFYDDTNYDEIIEVARAIIADPRFYQLQYSVFNYLDVDNYDLNDDELLEMATLNKNASQWNKNVRLALVDNNDFIEQMLLKYIHLMSDAAWEIKRFGSLEDATLWCKRIT